MFHVARYFSSSSNFFSSFVKPGLNTRPQSADVFLLFQLQPYGDVMLKLREKSESSRLKAD